MFSSIQFAGHEEGKIENSIAVFLFHYGIWLFPTVLEVLHESYRAYAHDVMAAKTMVGHFTFVCSVTWPLNDSEAGGDLVLIQTSLLLLCKPSGCNAS